MIIVDGKKWFIVYFLRMSINLGLVVWNFFNSNLENYCFYTTDVRIDFFI